MSTRLPVLLHLVLCLSMLGLPHAARAEVVHDALRVEIDSNHTLPFLLDYAWLELQGSLGSLLDVSNERPADLAPMLAANALARSAMGLESSDDLAVACPPAPDLSAWNFDISALAAEDDNPWSCRYEIGLLDGGLFHLGKERTVRVGARVEDVSWHLDTGPSDFAVPFLGVLHTFTGLKAELVNSGAEADAWLAEMGEAGVLEWAADAILDAGVLGLAGAPTDAALAAFDGYDPKTQQLVRIHGDVRTDLVLDLVLELRCPKSGKQCPKWIKKAAKKGGLSKVVDGDEKAFEKSYPVSVTGVELDMIALLSLVDDGAGTRLELSALHVAELAPVYAVLPAGDLSSDAASVLLKIFEKSKIDALADKLLVVSLGTILNDWLDFFGQTFDAIGGVGTGLAGRLAAQLIVGATLDTDLLALNHAATLPFVGMTEVEPTKLSHAGPETTAHLSATSEPPASLCMTGPRPSLSTPTGSPHPKLPDYEVGLMVAEPAMQRVVDAAVDAWDWCGETYPLSLGPASLVLSLDVPEYPAFQWAADENQLTPGGLAYLATVVFDAGTPGTAGLTAKAHPAAPSNSVVPPTLWTWSGDLVVYLDLHEVSTGPGPTTWWLGPVEAGADPQLDGTFQPVSPNNAILGAILGAMPGVVHVEVPSDYAPVGICAWIEPEAVDIDGDFAGFPVELSVEPPTGCP